MTGVIVPKGLPELQACQLCSPARCLGLDDATSFHLWQACFRIWCIRKLLLLSLGQCSARLMETLTPACSSPLSKLHRRFVTHDGALPVFMPVSPCRADQTPISTWCFEAGTEQVHSLNFAIHFLMSQWLSTAMSSFAAHRQDYKQKECDMKDQRLEASKSWRDLEQSCRSIVSTVSTKRYADDQATG